MKWLLLALFLVGFTPITATHDSTENIDAEFKNIESSLQDQQFRVVKDTPVLSDLKDGEIVIFSSGTLNKLLFRSNQEVYAVQFSCITIRR